MSGRDKYQDHGDTERIHGEEDVVPGTYVTDEMHGDGEGREYTSSLDQEVNGWGEECVMRKERRGGRAFSSGKKRSAPAEDGMMSTRKSYEKWLLRE